MINDSLFFQPRNPVGIKSSSFSSANICKGEFRDPVEGWKTSIPFTKTNIEPLVLQDLLKIDVQKNYFSVA